VEKNVKEKGESLVKNKVPQNTLFPGAKEQNKKPLIIKEDVVNVVGTKNALKH